MDVNSAFLYGTIEELVYITQPPRSKDPDHLDKVYKVVKVLYGLHQAPRAWYDTLANYLLSNGFQRGKIDPTLFIKKQKGDIMLVQIYVDDIIFGFQVTPKTSHLLAEKRISRYLKGKPTLGLWYLRDSSFDLVAYTDSDYAGATQDRKSTTGGCQFLGNRLISWQCKKQTVVATSITEAEYVAAASCCEQGRLIVSINSHEWIEGHATSNKSVCRVNPLGNSKEVGTLRYLGLMVPLKNVGDKAVNKEWGDIMERASTTASSLEAKHDSENPVIYVLLIHQFWKTASLSTSKNGEIVITATIDKRVKSVTEASIRRHLKLEDSKGISSLPNF
nr:hypothetical protein [Tanacetum cinerariifolium]